MTKIIGEVFYTTDTPKAAEAPGGRGRTDHMGWQTKGRTEETIQVGVAEYGKRRLMTYAESFRELAKSMEGVPEESQEPEEIRAEDGGAKAHRMNREAVIGAGITGDRSAVLAMGQARESRQVLCGNLKEMAQIMERVATEVFRLRPFEEKKKKAVTQALKGEGIRVNDVYYVDRPGERMAIGLSLQGKEGVDMTAERAADLVSVVLDRRLVPGPASPYRLGSEPESFVFVEEPSFVVLTGTARAVKEGEICSGDHYAVMEGENGRLTVLLSDGMGSGEKASGDSERILDLLERLVEAGYTLPEALRLVNDSVLAVPEARNMSTLDICDVDLYSGEYVLYKMGASPTFLKRGHSVETVCGSSLPLGILRDSRPQVETGRLSDGEYCIMMTDGVLDALKENRYEETMCRIIENVGDANPKEIARKILQFVLHCSGGRIRDDMTVVVLGIWENT